MLNFFLLRWNVPVYTGGAYATYSMQEILWADGGLVPNLRKPIYDMYNTGGDEFDGTWRYPYNPSYNVIAVTNLLSDMTNVKVTDKYKVLCSAPKAGWFAVVCIPLQTK